MKKKTVTKRRVSSIRRKSPKKLHHRVISFFKGDGGIYVIFVLATVMAGAFALTGGVLPTLDPKPSAANQVTIDPDSAKQSSESALQLVDLKVKPTDTPTPTPLKTPTPSPTKVVTPPPPDACLDKTVITLLLDVSTSMNNSSKIDKLNTAMGNFVSKLRPETVVGAVEFAGLDSFPSPDNGAKTLLSYTKYKGNETKIKNTLTSLYIHSDSSNDGTYIRNAFSKGISVIDASSQKYRDAGYKLVTILFTDGVPETQYTDYNCRVEFSNPYLCFANVQDPRKTGSREDLTAKMKGKVDKVYSVGIYTGARELQAYTEAKTMLSDIASKPTYAKSSKDATAMNQLFQDAINSVCD